MVKNYKIKPLEFEKVQSRFTSGPSGDEFRDKFFRDSWVSRVNMGCFHLNIYIDYITDHKAYRVIMNTSTPTNIIESFGEGFNTYTKYGFETLESAKEYANDIFIINFSRFIDKFKHDISKYVIEEEEWNDG